MLKYNYLYSLSETERYTVLGMHVDSTVSK